MKRLKILVISLILIMSFNYFAPIVYAVENNTKDAESSNKKDENIISANRAAANEIKVQSAEEDTKIEFTDENLKKYMQENYDKNGDGKITAKDVAEITEIKIPYIKEEAIDLKGIENFTELKKLEISNCKNYKVLANLTKLESVTIPYYRSDFENFNEMDELKNIPNLKELILKDVNFISYDISKLPQNLEKLEIANLTSLDISKITSFTNLKELVITVINDEIKGLEAINQLPNLESLEISNCKNFKDISALKNNNSIVNLNIKNDKVEYIAPVTTMKKLKALNCAENCIQDMSVLENTTLLAGEMYQKFTMNNVVVEQGEKIEIELPETMKSACNPNSKLYIENLNAGFAGASDYVSFDSKNLKVIIDATNMEAGEKNCTMYLWGTAGYLKNTYLNINYLVAKKADNKTEIQFENEKLKQYMLDNYDYDQDKKITQFDLAQITELDLRYVDENDVINLSGLENCISLKKLQIGKCSNYVTLSQLQELENIKIDGIYDINQLNELTQISNLREIELENIDLENYNIGQLPTGIERLTLCCRNINLTPLTKFNNLTDIYITEQNEIIPEGIEVINQISTLKKVGITNCQSLRDIEFLRDNNSIENLNISNNQIEDITPVTTMKKLQKLECYGNNIQDISILENTILIGENSDLRQELKIKDVVVEKGKSIEIDIPKTVKTALNSNSKFYVPNATLEVTDNQNVSINADNTKIIIDATNDDIGEKKAYITVKSDNSWGNLSYTRIELQYRVAILADDNQEIQFNSETLKNYLLNCYDVNKDQKITAYDMAQITELDLTSFSSYEMIDLQGLEYATSLQGLVTSNVTNLKVLSNLSQLEKITLQRMNSQEDFQALCNMSNLKELRLSNANLQTYNYSNLPKQIEKLELSCCNLTNISALNQFTNLKELKIEAVNMGYNEKIQGLESINQLPNLNILVMENARLTDLEFLRGNQTIETLNVSYNKITNIDAIATMSNLKTVSLQENNIEDLSVIKSRPTLLENTSAQQLINCEAEGMSGQEIEVELPQIAKDILNSQDIFYISDLSLAQFASISHNTTEPRARLSDDKTKILINTKGIDIGYGEETIEFRGTGALANTRVSVNYKVWANGDKTKEVNIPDVNLKQDLLDKYDCDNDGKITEFDMAQIQSLYLIGSVKDTEGLQYAKNVNYLQIYIQGNWQNVDLTNLGNLTKLKTLNISGYVGSLEFAKKLANLKSLTLNTSANNFNELVKSLKDLQNLEILELSGDSKASDLSAISNMKNLTRLRLSGYGKFIQSINTIKSLPSLQELEIYRYDFSEQEKDPIDYTAIKNFKNLTTLEITDKSLKLDCSNISNKLTMLNLQCDSLENIDSLKNLKELINVQITRSKLDNIEFVKNLKIYNLKLQDNLITDISPLKDSTISYADLRNNPINPKEAQNAEVIEQYGKPDENGYYRTLQLTDYAKLENVKFTKTEFKNQLLESYDLNRDGELSKYELEQITTLNNVKELENTEYMPNLQVVGISGTTMTIEQQKELIKAINNLSPNIKIADIYSVQTNLGEFNQSTEKYKMTLEEACPLLAEMQNPNSRLYQGKVEILYYDDSEYDKYLEIENGNIVIDRSVVGNLSHYTSYKLGNKPNTTFGMCFSWRNKTTGDKTKVITVKDTNFQKVLSEKYDIDKDGKFTEYDANNIGELDISNSEISDLTGIEQLKNLRELEASNNNISNIELLMSLSNLTGILLYNNKITDITCIKNRKFKHMYSLELQSNYIDFSNDSEQTKSYLEEQKKDNPNDFIQLTAMAATQRVGKPSEENNEVKMDAKIKQKLIAAGADLNKDGKLTQKELNDATLEDTTGGEYKEPIVTSLDLSNLGLTSIEGIQYLSGLMDLNLSHNQISDLTPLSKMMNLEKLDLSYNNITSISKLPYYANIYLEGDKKQYILSHNKITDISCINNWNISKLTDFSNGEGIDRRIYDIDLSYNQIENISGVKNYVRLKKLNLSNNKIKDISSLKDYNFTINPHVSYEDYKELLEDFEGIDVSSNNINVNTAENKKAIEVFKNKKVTLNVDNQIVNLVTNLPFKDVPQKEWYYDAVKYVYERKIMSGTSTTGFSPDVKTTRGMIVTMLHNMENSPYQAGASKFSDVQNQKDYYYMAVKWATSNKIISGYNNGKFGPNDPITREQLSVILNQYCNYKGKYKKVYADFSKFKDSNKVSSYAKWGMNWAVGNKIINGSNGNLNPQGTATRAEAAAMLSNYCKSIK